MAKSTMKVLFVGNYDLAGSYLAQRLYKEGNRLCWITSESHRELFFRGTKGKVYRVEPDYHTCAQILAMESVNYVVFLSGGIRSGDTDGHQSGRMLQAIRSVLHAGLNYKLTGVAYLSASELSNQDLLTADLEELRGAERVVSAFCQAHSMRCTILRLGQVYGRGLYGDLGLLGDAMEKIQGGEGALFCPFTRDSRIDLLDGGDAADAVYRLVSELHSGVYTVTTGYPVTMEQLYTTAALQLGYQGEIFYGDLVHQENPAACTPLKEQTGWMPFHRFDQEGGQAVRSILEFNRQAAENQEEVRRKNIGGSPLFKMILETGQTLLLFVALLLLSSFMPDWSDLRLVDLRLMYVVIVAVSFGMRQGLLATVLACVAYILGVMRSGVDPSYMLYSIDYWVPFAVYGTVGATLGYITGKRNDDLHVLQKEYDDLDEEYNFLKGTYREMAQVKNHLQKQIMISKESFSSIYEITERLNSLSPRMILFKTVKVLEETMECPNVAIYILPNQGGGYGRLMACSASLASKLNPSLNVENIPEIWEAVGQGQMFVNCDLIPNYPGYVMPVCNGDTVTSMVMLYDLEPEKFTVHYRNLFRTVVQLVQQNMVRAWQYESAAKEGRYFPGSRVLHPQALREELETLEMASQELNYQYDVARVGLPAGMDQAEGVRRMERLVRGTDLLGCNEQGGYQAVFLFAGQAGRMQIEERFRANGLELAWEV